MSDLFFVCIIVVFLGTLLWFAKEKDSERNRFMTECVADGHKPYQCEAFRKSCDKTILIPMVTP